MSPAVLAGPQHTLRAGGYEAVVTGIGAALRVLRDAAGDLVLPFDDDADRVAMRGALLAPWPNRTADGRYRFRGVEHQLEVNEPERGNAAHGLASGLPFRLVSRSDGHVVLSAVIADQPGYPWRVRLDVRFSLDADGLLQEVTAVNESAEPAPYGVAGHPYLLAGPAAPDAVDGWSLQLPAREVLHVSPDRLLPTRLAPVDADGGVLDFRRARTVGDTAINHAFADLTRDADGWARTRVTDADGHGVELACDAGCRWVQVYTSDEGTGDSRRAGIAVEPMSCPPDALNSQTDLEVLEPGGSFRAAWVIRRIGDRPHA